MSCQHFMSDLFLCKILFGKSFGEYRFFLPERIERGNVYLVGKEDKIYAGEDLSAYSVTYFENYYVIDAT